MVTFALPGDDNAGDAPPNGTPRSRPPLPFSKRSFTASPYSGSPAKRSGVLNSSLSRKLLTPRDEGQQPSGLNNSSIAAARNIFRSSTISDTPPTASFSPKLPQNTMRTMFAPGATPEPTRTYRGSAAQATPRGMASKAADKELFPMRISSPPPELTGELLSQQVPREWDSKGSIYADQFLSHLCPPGLDEEQRRQFFCILDLRRLKYAANEIFSKKDWKLNVINFAKEFEKSRSIILLRYGLYEFQNVKPSKDVLKRWRREHGLPEPDDEPAEPSPSRLASTRKRKADDDTVMHAAAAAGTPSQNKRRVLDLQEPDEPVAATPVPAKIKRKASPGEEHPAKVHKATPSSAKSLFEKIANKPATPAQASDNAATAKPNPFAANRSGSSSLARSVLMNQKSFPAPAAAAGANIFGYLSDASSAKNSGVDADTESDGESGSGGGESPEAGQGDGPSAAASGTMETAARTDSGLFGKREAPAAAAFGTGVPSDAGTREGTPGRSLFERITKGSDGQPRRADGTVDAPSPEKQQAAPANQTWNPTTTPLKFAPSTSAAPKGSLFGAAPTPASSAALKDTTTSSMFGATKQGPPPAQESSVGASAGESGKDGGESDKENESQPAKKPAFELKAPAPAPAAAPAAQQPAFGSSIFSPKPTSSEPRKDAEAPKPAPGLLGAASGAESKADAQTTGNIFGTLGKPAAAAATAFGTPSTNLFGAKPAQRDKPAESEAPKTTSLFGGQNAASPFGGSGAATPVFGSKPAATPGSASGSGPSAPTTSLFGNSSSVLGNAKTAPAKTGAAPAEAEAPAKALFGFASTRAPEKPGAGALDTTEKTMSGGPKSPPASGAANGIFGGSPMKQDEPSPAEKTSTEGSNGGSSAPMFKFGDPPAAAGGESAKPPAAAAAAAAPSMSFGGAAPAPNAGSGSFSFNFGAGGSSGGSFTNPFASSSSTVGPSPGASFSFGGGPSAPAGGASSMFQFGGGSSNSAAPAASGGPLFGASQASASFPAPTFTGAPSSGGGPSFSFSGTPSQPAQGTGSMFGTNQTAPPVFAGLQPPAGGSSTTGTNSPLNLGGGSSLATTPAAGTPEPSTQADGSAGGQEGEEGEKHEQINLTDGVDEGDEVLYEVRAKALKFVAPDDKAKSKSPWSTQGVGPLRLLRHKESGVVRLLLRAEPRGHVALNRALLPSMQYKAEEKYVKITTSNETGDGLETWMLQVKTKDSAKKLADVLEERKGDNRK